MKSLKPSHVIVALGATVVALWGGQVVRMQDQGVFDFTPNPAALGGSPYGRTLAMVVQGPVDRYWHGGAEPGHVHGPECNHEHGAVEETHADGLIGRVVEMVAHLDLVVQQRNTPREQTQAHVRYLRRQIERKLETAYWLDPGNYANFNALMLFLSEDGIPTRAVSPQRVLYFADFTIAHVEKNEMFNPEAWLTAASAVQVKVEIISKAGGKLPESLTEQERLLAQFEQCLARFAFLRDIQLATRRWPALSSERRSSMEDRAKLLNKLLEGHTAILRRKTTEPAPH